MNIFKLKCFGLSDLISNAFITVCIVIEFQRGNYSACWFALAFMYMNILWGVKEELHKLDKCLLKELLNG